MFLILPKLHKRTIIAKGAKTKQLLYVVFVKSIKLVKALTVVTIEMLKNHDFLPW